CVPRRCITAPDEDGIWGWRTVNAILLLLYYRTVLQDASPRLIGGYRASPRKALQGGLLFFFFSSRRRHTRLVSDWSSDVCSSDLSWVAAGSKRTRNGGRATWGGRGTLPRCGARPSTRAMACAWRWTRARYPTDN